MNDRRRSAAAPSRLAHLGGTFARDLRLAVRGMARRPGFATVTVLTLALAIGANAAVFGLARGILWRPLPFPEPERLVRLWEVSRDGGRMGLAWRNFTDLVAAVESFDTLAAWQAGPTTVLAEGRAVRTGAAAVSPGLLATLGAAPVRGRLPTAEEHAAGDRPVAVVSHAFWRDLLGGRELGTARLEVWGLSLEVIGVLPSSFAFPTGVDVWLPAQLLQPGDSRTAHNWSALGRLAPGVPARRAQAEASAIAAAIGDIDPADDYLPVAARVESLSEATVGDARRPLAILAGAAFLVLLVACANLAAAFLARGLQRRGELAVRASLGASRGRLLRQVATESVVLAAAGAGLGLALAAGVLRRVAAAPEAPLPRLESLSIDLPVVAFTAGVALLTALVATLAPTLRLLAGAGAELGLAARRPDGGRRRGLRLAVVAESAAALALLVGAGLLLSSLANVVDQELGFSIEERVTADLHLPANRYPEASDVAGYHAALLAEVGSLPGVERAAVVSSLPLVGPDANGRIDVSGGPSTAVDASYRAIGGDYFRALGIPLLAGRTFEPRDDERARHAAVVSRSFAELAWPGDDPLGKQITGGGMDAYWDQDVWATVVGVVGDVRHRDPREPARPTVYFHLPQRPSRLRSATLLVAGDTARELAGPVADRIQRLDPEVAVELAPLSRRLDDLHAPHRFLLAVLAGFAAAALALAAVGLLGVVSQQVEARRREMGIRIALGAAPTRVRNAVLRTALGDVATGAAGGLVLALLGRRLLGSLLYQVDGLPATVAAAAGATLAATALAAAWIPARRILSIDPVRVLGAE